MKRMTLGDLLGSLSYFGKCSRCGTQFMSLYDVVILDGAAHYCTRCEGSHNR